MGVMQGKGNGHVATAECQTEGRTTEKRTWHDGRPPVGNQTKGRSPEKQLSGHNGRSHMGAATVVRIRLLRRHVATVGGMGVRGYLGLWRRPRSSSYRVSCMGVMGTWLGVVCVLQGLMRSHVATAGRRAGVVGILQG